MAAKLHKVPPPAGEPDWKKLAAERAARDALAEATGLEGRYLDATLDNYKPRTPGQAEALAGCRRFVTGLHAWDGIAPLVERNLLLLGPPGTGKTHLLAGVVREIEESCCEWACFTTPQRLLRRIRDSWGRRRKPTDDQDEIVTESDVIQMYGSQVEVLALDDLGASGGGDGELALLGEVIDVRSTHRKAIAATSNLLVSQLREAMGDRIFDRIMEDCLVLVVDGESYRRVR